MDVDEDAIAAADEQRVVQIIRNLVENAFVHTPPGTHVRLHTGRQEGGVVLSVEDDGPGIPPEQRAQVFERFFRGDGRQASGSGLGLAIALELAEAMGGTLSAREPPGANGLQPRAARGRPGARPSSPEPAPSGLSRRARRLTF